MPYYFFFLVLGLVIGGLTTWVFLAGHPFESVETPGGPVDAVEAALLVKQMETDGRPIDEATVARLLKLHGDYVDGTIREAQAAAERARLEAERIEVAGETAEDVV